MATNNADIGRGRRVEHFGLIRKDLHFLPSDIKIFLPYLVPKYTFQEIKEGPPNEVIARTIQGPIRGKPGADEAINWYSILPKQKCYITLMTQLKEGAPERTDVNWITPMRQRDMFIDNVRADAIEPRDIDFLGVVTIAHETARTEIMATFSAARDNIAEAGALKLKPSDGQLFRNCVRHNPIVRAHQYLLDTRKEEMGNASIKCIYLFTDGYHGPDRNLPFDVPRLHLLTVLERPAS